MGFIWKEGPIIATLKFESTEDWMEFKKEHLDQRCSDMNYLNSMELITVQQTYLPKEV